MRDRNLFDRFRKQSIDDGNGLNLESKPSVSFEFGFNPTDNFRRISSYNSKIRYILHYYGTQADNAVTSNFAMLFDVCAWCNMRSLPNTDIPTKNRVVTDKTKCTKLCIVPD